MKKLMLGLAFAVTAEAGWTKGGTGTETDPWNIGTRTYSYENVKAWTNGTGRLTIMGTGEMQNFKIPPWPNTIKEVVVGDGVTSIGECAFDKCGSLTSVEMPAVTSICYSAFSKCGSLESVAMPSVTSIGGAAFADCDSLTFVVMPSVTFIDGAAFRSCTNLTSIIIPKEEPPTCASPAFLYVPTTCTMFIPSTADVAAWRSVLSFDCWEGGYQAVPVVADGKGCSTSAEVNAAIADGCKQVVFCEDCNWGLVVPAGNGTTFDLCGKTLSGALTVNGGLTVNDTSYPKTGKVTGAVSVGADGSFTWKGSQNWTVATVGEIEQVMSFNRRFDTGIAVTMGDDIADAVELPAGESLTIDLNGKTFGGALTVNGGLTVNDTSDQRTGRVTGEVSVGADGSFTWNGSQNWTVATVGEIERAMSFNRRFDAGIAVTMGDDIADAVELPAGVPLTIDLNGKTFGGALTVNGDLTVKDSAGGGSVVQSEYPVVATTGSLKFKDAAITIKGSFSMPSAEQKPEPSGAVSGAEFESVQIVDGKAYLDVSVWTSDTITNQNWSVATNGVIEVPAEGKTGFFILQSKAAVPSDNNPANIIIEDR